MERWAVVYADKANFLCVGCAGGEMALEMGREAQLSKCWHGWIKDQDSMPRWGQLGCNGFIMLSAGEQEANARQTSAFMQVRGLAFKHVEAVLDAIIQGNPAPDVCPGQFVRLTGLKHRPELNGQMGVCISAIQEGRCTVRLQRSRREDLKVKPVNLTVHSDESLEPSSDCDDCQQGCPAPPDQGCGSCTAQPDSHPHPHPHSTAQPETIAPVRETASVAVESMDREHRQCEQALNQLASQRSISALETVLAGYKQHFAHEEELMDRWVWPAVVAQTKGKSGFSAEGSARRTHLADHARMVRCLEREIERSRGKVSQCHGKDNQCHGLGRCHGNGGDDSKGAFEARCFHGLSLIHISEPTRLLSISYAVFCLKKKKTNKKNKKTIVNKKKTETEIKNIRRKN
eukprot:TRINITY_DN8950_c0_g3_i1.p1 TRINITY_DN8950_c0_g3~~TRINITY_DN8950_c0_g3_i1.p1  ORF type:complete len:402 (-),score=58.03 TRINITY_DN8950_c0_g3_i1:33-1238(-)